MHNKIIMTLNNIIFFFSIMLVSALNIHINQYKTAIWQNFWSIKKLIDKGNTIKAGLALRQGELDNSLGPQLEGGPHKKISGFIMHSYGPSHKVSCAELCMHACII